jgi:hypothetical protein
MPAQRRFKANGRRGRDNAYKLLCKSFAATGSIKMGGNQTPVIGHQEKTFL